MRALALLGLLATASWSQMNPEVVSGNPNAPGPYISLDQPFSCGLITKFSPNKLQDANCFQNLDNIILDQDNTLSRRLGYASYFNTACTGGQSVRGMWPFFGTDGSQYLIMFSSGSMFSSKADGTCAAIAGLSGLSMTAQMSCVQGMGYLWCTDGIDPVFNTNVVSTNVVSQAPTGKYIGFFRNRIVIGGVSGNLTNIYMSGELNGYDFTLPTVVDYSTSSNIINISGTNDGQAVSCLLGQFQNNFYIGRQYDLYALSGYSNADFTLRKVSDQIGCMDNNSPQEVNNVLMWLSHRGIEGLSGTQINWLSYPIDPTLQTIITAAGNSQSETINGNNFADGNFTASGNGAPTSDSVIPGNVTPSYYSITDSSANWTDLINVSTSNPWITPGELSLVISTTGLAIPGSAYPWVCGPTSGSAVCYNSSPPSPYESCNNIGGGFGGNCGLISGPAGGGDTTVVNILNGNGGAVIETLSLDSMCPGFNYQNQFVSNSCYLSLANISTTTIQIEYSKSGSGASANLYTNPIPTPWNLNFLVYTIWNTGHGDLSYIGDVSVSSYVPTGYMLSDVFDTTFSTPIGGALVQISSIPSSTAINISVRQSTSAGGPFGPWISITNGNNVPLTEEFWQYESTLTTSLGWSTPILTNTSLSAATTGYYISPCVTVSSPTSWGNFTVDAVTDGGSLTFWVSTGATCAIATATNANWTLQNPNAIITVNPTTEDVAARVLFDIDAATEVPTLNEMTFNWNQGASRPPVASATYKNRYYMFYTTSTAVGAANDHALIYDQGGHWVLFDDQRAASAALYLNQLYFGDSQATGQVYLMDSGYSDNGGDFTYSFTTPDLDGGDPLSPKEFQSLYVMLSAPNATTGGSTMSCAYAVDGATTTYSLGTVDLSEAPQASGYFLAKVPFPLVNGQAPTGHWINISCNNVGANGPIEIYGMRVVFTPESWQ